MARRRLTDRGVTALKPRAKRFTHPDPELPCHYIRVLPTGVKTFCAVSRTPWGKQVWVTIGPTTLLSIEEARDKARAGIKRIRVGESGAEPGSFTEVAEDWFARHVEKNGLRSKDAIRSVLDRQLLPAWKARAFTTLKRGDITNRLDRIEDESGPQAADAALSIVRNIGNWFSSRHDDYVSPIVRGMKRSTSRARERILTDDELATVWKAAESGIFGAFVRLLLLTAQRREKVAAMRWQDVSVDGVWTIPSEAREKGNALELVLPDTALAIIRSQPRFADNPFVFAGRGNSHLKGYSKAKRVLDAKLDGVKPWRLHDLRRTARSLMSRAGVAPHVAELT